MKMTVFRHTVLLVLLCSAAPAVAQQFENLERLERQLVAVLGANIGDPGGPATPIDRRLKLAPCNEGAVFDPPAMGAVAIRCPSLGWRIRVALVRPAVAVADVAAAPVIKRGDPVEVEAGGKYFTVTTQAIAEQDGVPGARIRVRSGPKSAPMMVEVVREGVVRVPGFKEK